MYRHVEDIDLFTGGLSEPSLPGGVVGQTFGCIIAAQFDRLKRCDRFWWENPSEFSPQQRQEIRKSTVASVMCRNWDSPGKVQPLAFDLVDSDINPLSECMSLANQIDIRAWREASTGKEERNQKSLESNDDSLQPEKKSCDVNGWIISVGEEREVGACTKCSCTPGLVTKVVFLIVFPEKDKKVGQKAKGIVKCSFAWLLYTVGLAKIFGVSIFKLHS